MKHQIRVFLYKYGYRDSIIQKIWIIVTRPFSKFFKSLKAKRVNSLGNEVLSILCTVSKQQGILIWPEFGTLLGAYRNKSFISYDPDIDVGILSDHSLEGLYSSLESYGISKHRCMFLVNTGTKQKRLVEVTLKYKGLCFDLFLCDKLDSSRRRVFVAYAKIDELNNLYRVKYYTVNYNDVTEQVRINQQELSFPGSVLDYLKSIYGEDFMIPIKDWTPPKDNPFLTFIEPEDYYIEAIYYE